MSYVRGQCLISIRLAKDETASLKDPGSLLLVAPLVAYLPAYYSVIQDHFADFVSNTASGLHPSFFHSGDMTPLAWHYPIGVQLDLVGARVSEEARLDLVVRFGYHKVRKEHFIEPRSPYLFGSLFFNQLKVSLSMQGKGLSQLNILPKEETDILQSIAAGGGGADVPPMNIDSFFEVFNSVFRFTEASVGAIKIYLRKGGEVHTQVTSAAFEESSLSGEATVSKLLLSKWEVEDYAALKVFTQGIELHPDTPLEFLQRECCYADGFVHLVVLESN